MKVKIIGKEKITKRETNQSWISIHAVTDVKCSNAGGISYGGFRVHQFMIDVKPEFENLQIGKEYEAIMQERFFNGAIQSRIVGLI